MQRPCMIGLISDQLSCKLFGSLLVAICLSVLDLAAAHLFAIDYFSKEGNTVARFCSAMFRRSFGEGCGDPNFLEIQIKRKLKRKRKR